jgi:hypothetical protein
MGITHSERTKEQIMSIRENESSGFIREAVLIPEVLMIIISFPLIISTRRMSMDIRNDRGSIRLK